MSTSGEQAGTNYRGSASGRGPGTRLCCICFLSFQVESGKIRLSSVTWMALAAIGHLAHV